MRRNLVFLPYNTEKNGFFYWLGTIDNTKPYTNPAKNKAVKCTASSFLSSPSYRHTVDHFVDKDLGYIYTADSPNGWFAVSLKPCKMLFNPTHYTISTMLSQSWAYIRNWNLEGSLDGVHWDIIKKHEDEEALKKSNDSACFQVQCYGWYSHFRIHNYGPTERNSNHLCCSQFELYGTVQKLPNSSFYG
jgi:hypothetical protein